jgi:hypothetical protein
MRPSDIRATSRPRSTGTLDSLAIKLTDLSSFPTSIRLYYGRTLPTVDEVSAAILKEYEIYLRLKEDGLEGDIAPNFFGLWGSAQSQNSVKSTTDQGQEDEEDTAVREGDKSSRQVWLLVLQDVGESMSKGEKDVSGVR